ncbi:MAG: UbiA family prenyltransferase [Candidatus Thermoplasmatota archaeon]
MKLAIGLLKLIRPLNCLMASLGIGIGALVGGGIPIEYSIVILGMVIGALYTGGGNSLNDYFDRDIDRINHPERPIPLGYVKPKTAIIFSIFLFSLGLCLVLITNNLLCIGIVVINLVLLILYEIKLKNIGFMGNICISWLTASLFIFGGALVNKIFLPLFLSLLAFFACLGREIVKDIEDIGGDEEKRKTLPMEIGIRKASAFAAIFFFIAIILSPLPYYPLSIYHSYSYITIISIADAIFLYSLILIFKSPKMSSITAKVGMCCALIAFALEGLI